MLKQKKKNNANRIERAKKDDENYPYSDGSKHDPKTVSFTSIFGPLTINNRYDTKKGIQGLKWSEITEDNFVLVKAGNEKELKKALKPIYAKTGKGDAIICLPGTKTPVMFIKGYGKDDDKRLYYFNMDQTKWDSGVKEKTASKYSYQTRALRLDEVMPLINDCDVYILNITDDLIKQYQTLSKSRQDAQKGSINYNKIYSLVFIFLNKQNVFMNKNVCYTSIIGNYDLLENPEYITDSFDYICFTDNHELKSNIWKIIYIDNLNFTNVKNQRYIKLHPHEYLSDYEYSIYIDGNIVVKNDLNIIKNNICNKNISIYLKPHPDRRCSYMESFACACYGKDTLEHTSNQLLKYWKEGFPPNYGLCENNIICRYHNNEDCIKLMEFWWNEILHNSYRDQLSLFYSIWKLKMKNNIYVYNTEDMKLINNCFLWKKYHLLKN